VACTEQILRRCPLCLRDSIIGHGWRRKQAHDASHDWIKYRRGLCNLCKHALTFLPVFSLPYTHSWANQFLDAQKVRQLSLRSLRAYAYDLLHLARWFKNTQHSLGRLNQSLLLEYVRHQLEQQPSPTPQTINHRLCVLRCVYRFHYAQEIPGKPLFQRRYTTRSSLGYGRRQTKITTNLGRRYLAGPTRNCHP